MSNEVYAVEQGFAVAIAGTLRDTAGNVITSYTGSETIAATVWKGGNAASSFTAAANWSLPSAGTFRIVVSAAQTATLAPGRYEILLRLTDPFYGDVPAYEASLDVLASSGGIPANLPATIISAEEAAANVPGFDALATGQAQLLLDVTDAINAYCSRVFPLTTHDEHCYYERGTVRLKQYPVPSVSRLCMGLAHGLNVTNDGTLVRAGLVILPSTTAGDPNTVPATLRLTGYLSGVLTTTNLTLASYPMLSDLATAINSAGHGWAATLGDASYATRPSSDLNPDWGTRGVSTTGTPLRIYATDLTDYDLDYETGIITIRRMPDLLASCGLGYGLWGYSNHGNGRPQRPGKLAVRAIYQAGYDPVSMPASLKRAAFILVKAFAQRSVIGITVQQKIDVSFAIVTPNTMTAVDEFLDPYRRRRIF